MEKKSPALRVLIVDDEPLIRWSLAETLASSGHAVIEAGKGMGALRTLNNAQESVDVVLLEILMTAYGTPEITDGALKLGAYTVVDKPFEMHDMAALVLRAYGSRAH